MSDRTSTSSASPSPHDPPPRPDPRRITQLLRRYSEGQEGALADLMPLVYDDLKRIARNRLRSESDALTLHTTALVHESYLRLVEAAGTDLSDRSHFFGLASRVMRNILVDHARANRAAKRGGGRIHVPLSSDSASRAPRTLELIALDDALKRLGELDERMERVVECKVFGGMTTRETATIVRVAPRTVEKDWTMAKAFLHRELSASGDEKA